MYVTPPPIAPPPITPQICSKPSMFIKIKQPYTIGLIPPLGYEVHWKFLKCTVKKCSMPAGRRFQFASIQILGQNVKTSLLIKMILQIPRKIIKNIEIRGWNGLISLYRPPVRISTYNGVYTASDAAVWAELDLFHKEIDVRLMRR